MKNDSTELFSWLPLAVFIDTTGNLILFLDFIPSDLKIIGCFNWKEALYEFSVYFHPS